MRDRELVTEAIRKAGGQKLLADIFGVSQSAISEWGRTRPIPRHVRPRIEDYLRKNEAPKADANEKVEESPQAQARFLSPLVRLLELVGLASEAKSLSNLPPSARKRYEDRANELLAWLRRQLQEYQLLLEKGHRRKTRYPKKKRKRPEP